MSDFFIGENKSYLSTKPVENNNSISKENDFKFGDFSILSNIPNKAVYDAIEIFEKHICDEKYIRRKAFSRVICNVKKQY